MVERYNGKLERSIGGDWVRHYDYATLEERYMAALKGASRLEAECDYLKQYAAEKSNEKIAAEAAEARVRELEAALHKIAQHPESVSTPKRSYAGGWAFHNIRGIARAALAQGEKP